MTTSNTFLVLIAELDSGTMFLAGRSGTVGMDALTPAILSCSAAGTSGFNVTLEAQALPSYVYIENASELSTETEYWTNRGAILVEVESSDGSCYGGRQLFDGVFASEPTEQGGVLSVRLIPRRHTVVMLPDYGAVDTLTYPTSPASAQGALKPLVFGTVEACPLIPVSLPEHTTLTMAAYPLDAQLEVADTTLLAAAGSIVVDDITYSYTAKSGNILMGMAITGAHRAGTMVAQSGSAVFLAAGHPITALTALTADKTLLQGATIDLSAATVTFASLPKVVSSGERWNAAIQFDAVGTGNTALNTTNAIRYATRYPGSGTTSASALPGVIRNNSDPLASVITWARPVGGRIVSGVYTVAFTVAIGAQIGWARVKIGGDVVWQMEAPSSVVYNYSPATVMLDTDVDMLPVVVEVEQGGSVDQVTVTIVSAVRYVYVGNLDDANYATLRQPSDNVFRADQTTTNADLGTITKAQLVVRWFAGSAAMGTPTVKFGTAGSLKTLGTLAQTQLADSQLTKNITVDVTTQGQAALPQQTITTNVNKTDNSVNVPVNLPIAYVGYVQNGTAFQYALDTTISLPDGVVAGSYNFYIDLSPSKQPYGSGAMESYFRIENVTVTSAAGAYAPLLFVISLSANQKTIRVRHSATGIFYDDTNLTNYFSDQLISFYHALAKVVRGTVNIKPTQVALSVSGSSNPINAQALSHTGTTLTTNNGNISFTVPAPPRVVNTVFDLAEYSDWAQFTNKQVEISYAGGTGVDLCIVQVYLSVEYDVPTYKAVGTSDAPLSATITGKSGNPADVLAFLFTASGSAQRIDAASKARLSAWCTDNGYIFARRIADSIDALQLLTYASEQSMVEMCDTANGMAMVRWFDQAEQATIIAPGDLLDHAQLGWAERIENSITLGYHHDYAGAANKGFTRTMALTATTNNDCRRGVAAIAETRRVVLDGGFIRNDTTASLFITAYARRYARPRRIFNFKLPFTYSALMPGALLSYATIDLRVTSLNNDNGWIDVTTEEIME